MNETAEARTVIGVDPIPAEQSSAPARSEHRLPVWKRPFVSLLAAVGIAAGAGATAHYSDEIKKPFETTGQVTQEMGGMFKQAAGNPVDTLGSGPLDGPGNPSTPTPNSK